MPAVQLSRLAQQVEVLVSQFARPAEFIRRLRDLFELYADRVYRAGQTVPPASLAPAYHVPPLVMRQLEIELRSSCRLHPAAAFTLVDKLFGESMLEFCVLGAILLGNIPLQPAEPVLERMHRFAKPGIDSQVLTAILQQGGRALRRDLPAAWIELIEDWANEPLASYQAIALRAIITTSKDESFDNLPPVLRIFSSLLQAGQVTLQSELQTALLALLRRSPKETVFLLRQVLSISSSPTTHRLARLSLSQIPPEYQESLRQVLQTYRKN